MAEHELNKIVDDDGEVFNLRDSTKQPTADRVTSWGSTPSDTKYPSEKLVKTSLDAKAPNAPSEVTIATGDKPLIADSSDSNKVKRTSISFDTGVTNTMLRKDGTFAKALYADEGWGGTWGTALAPMDTYLLQQRNCFFGAKPSAVSVEYSTDGGSTWIDYGLNDEQKRNLFSQYAGMGVYCGKNTHILPTYTGSIVGTKDLSNANVANQRLRITICCRSLATEGTTSQTDKWLYATIRRVGIYMSTNSASKGPRHCVFTAKKREDFNAGNDTWINFGDYSISGDSGWNSIPCNNKATSSGITLGDSFSGQYAAFRFEVWSEGVNDPPAPSQTGNMIITKIVAFSELCWTNNSSNSNLANYGMPCTVNASTGSASFSKGITSGVAIPVGSGGTGKTSVTAGNYLVGNGTSALTEKTPNKAANDLINALSTGEATPTGDDYYVAQFAGGGTTTKTYHRRPVKALWEYIKSQISSVLGLTATSYGGNAATATALASGSADRTKLDGIAAGAEVNVQSDWSQSTTTADDYIKNKPTIPAAVSVKGNAESSYRTGQVNLTPANLGISATATSVTVGSTTFNQYTHPTSAGNKHVPSGGSSGQFLGYGGSSGTAEWKDLPKGYTTFVPSSETLRAYKRLAIGKTSVNLTSANAVKASFIVRIHVNYCDLGGNVTAEGMLITMMANVCFRTDQLAEMRLDAMGEARWDYEKIRPVLVSFSVQEDNITKYVVCLGFGDGTNGTTLKPFGYSYIDIMPITSDMGWEWIDGGDSTSTYDHITQMVRETGGRLGSSSGSSSLPVFVNSKGEFESVNAANTANNMLKSLPGWTATPTDSTYLVRRDTGGTETFGQVQFSTVWDYIKGKMSSDPSGVLNGRVAGFTSNIWGTGAKRIALGYANLSSTDAWYNAIFLLKTGYNSTIGDGKSIAIMVSYCQRNSTRNVKSRVLLNNKWPLDLIPGVFTLQTDSNTKLIIGFAVRDSSNNLVNLQYSEFNVIVLGKEENWTDQVTSDSVNGYDYFFESVQNPDIVVASTLPSTPEDNTLYFV